MTDQLALAFADRHAGQSANLAANQAGHRDDRSRVDVAVEVAFVGRRFLGIKGGYQFEPDEKQEEAA